MIKPPVLQSGDTVGLISPSSPVHEHGDVTEAELQRGIECLKALGFQVRLGKHAREVRGYLAGTDQSRADDLHAMFDDKTIRGIFCIQGGYGTPRLLPYLNWNLIRKNPKTFMGYSDVTALNVTIHQQAGLVTFQGPMVGYDMAHEFTYTKLWFERAVMRREPIGEIKNPDDGPEIVSISSGRATGRLTGGNLSLLIATLGTPYEVDTKNAIVFLEDTDELPYRFDRMLTHFALAGKLRDAAGIVIGECVDCVPKNAKKPSLTIPEILDDLIRPLNKPAIYGVCCGHGKKKVTLPYGVQATVDADACRLVIEEAAVE
jgi:muramoyltetrapeptide carboxypeptidase